MSVFVGAEELGRLLGIGENSLLAMARERRIPAVVIGRRVLFHPDDVEAALRAEGRRMTEPWEEEGRTAAADSPSDPTGAGEHPRRHPPAPRRTSRWT